MSLSGEKSFGASGFIGTLVITIALCAPGFKSYAESGEATNRPLVDDKYSLKEDRQAMESLRKNIPPEVKKENDEKAFMEQMMSDLDREPSEVRSRFQTIINKKRENFNKDMTKKREEFYKTQSKDREAFTKDQGQTRQDFAKKKTTSDERRSFFDDLESKRQDFFAQQKEKRDTFEADMRDQRRNFDDYIRAKTDEFNQRHRDYVKRREEHRKAMDDLKKQAAEKRKNLEKNVDKEYDEVRKKPVTPLEVGE